MDKVKTFSSHMKSKMIKKTSEKLKRTLSVFKDIPKKALRYPHDILKISSGYS